MSYSKIKIYGSSNVNYLHALNYVATESEIKTINDAGLFVPEWVLNKTKLLATFQNSLNGANIQETSGNVVSYRIFRKNVHEDKLYNVVFTDKMAVSDYNVSNNIKYQYYVFPTIEVDGEQSLGSPIITDEITPFVDGNIIIGLKSTDVKNEYVVDKDNIWFFFANIEHNDYSLNTDKTFVDGFGKYPKQNKGLRQYITGGMNALFGTVNKDCSSFDSSVSMLEEWENFCASSCLKLFKDWHGRTLVVDIKEEKSNYMFSGLNSPITTSFSIVEVADYKTISVYDTEGV